MSPKNHRPFANLTWAQLDTVRDAAHDKLQYVHGDKKRALWALTKKTTPLIKLGNKAELTPEGEKVWRKMQD